MVCDLHNYNFFSSGGIVADHFNYSAYGYYYRQTTQSLINFECKNGSLQDCTYETVDSCSLYNGDVVIECYIGE